MPDYVTENEERRHGHIRYEANPRIVNFDISNKNVTCYSRCRWLAEG